jgi:hypothetical protein
MLNEMRFGQMKPKSVARFKALAREVKYEDGINATELYVAIFFPAFFDYRLPLVVKLSLACLPVTSLHNR